MRKRPESVQNKELSRVSHSSCIPQKFSPKGAALTEQILIDGSSIYLGLYGKILPGQSDDDGAIAEGVADLSAVNREFT
jgi:hypothetical protein